MCLQLFLMSTVLGTSILDARDATVRISLLSHASGTGFMLAKDMSRFVVLSATLGSIHIQHETLHVWIMI